MHVPFDTRKKVELQRSECRLFGDFCVNLLGLEHFWVFPTTSTPRRKR